MKEYRVASLFAGIGGICLGFNQAGFKIVWANELDRNACKTYIHNLGSRYLVNDDIRRIHSNMLPDFDVLAAGFPCQPFSIAGRQRGFKDYRGNLFFEITRIIDSKRPDIVFLENVPNLIEHDGGKTFLVIYTSLAQFGYYVRYAVLPAHKYGNCPQTRSRIYIVAFKELEACDKFSFPEEVGLTVRVSDIVNTRIKQNDIYYYLEDSAIKRKIASVVTEYGRIYNMFGGMPRRVTSGLCPTLVADMGKHPNRVPVIMDDFGYRKLTLRECLDMQGFPKNYYFPNTINISNAYMQIGNSVCVPVIRRIASEIMSVMS